MKLKINFAGICTHFRQGVAAGVPHRVVLPDATNFVTGLLTVTEGSLEPKQVLYYLMPHYAQLDFPGMEIHVPSLTASDGPAVVDGDVLAPIRLQVANAVEQELEYACEDDTHSLTEFVPDYTFSSDVVVNGRAACYFDLYGGRVSSHKTGNGASQTIVELTTYGVPELLVTPLASSTGPVRSYRFKLCSDTAQEDEPLTLTVKNLELSHTEPLEQQGGAFDYLLHYLTSRGGIPQTIQKRTPGLDEKNLVSVTQDQLSQTFAGMAAALKPGKRDLVPAWEATPACGDSRYP